MSCFEKEGEGEGRREGGRAGGKHGTYRSTASMKSKSLMASPTAC